MKIQLSHYEFDLSDFYRAGTIIGESEAKALNLARAERIRNRVARWLDRAAPEKQVLTAEKRAELYAWVVELDGNFQFETRPGTKAKVGTIEAEIAEVARERAATLAREAGRGQDEGLIGELFQGLLDNPEVEAEAARRIEIRKQVALEGIGDL